MKYMYALFMEEMDMSDFPPEAMAESFAKWQAFGDDARAQNKFLAGEGLQPSETATTLVVGEGDHAVSDGPFAETREQLAGFYLLDCNDLDEALDWAKKIPLGPGGKIEVRPVMDYPTE